MSEQNAKRAKPNPPVFDWQAVANGKKTVIKAAAGISKSELEHELVQLRAGIESDQDKRVNLYDRLRSGKGWCMVRLILEPVPYNIKEVDLRTGGRHWQDLVHLLAGKHHKDICDPDKAYHTVHDNISFVDGETGKLMNLHFEINGSTVIRSHQDQMKMPHALMAVDMVTGRFLTRIIHVHDMDEVVVSHDQFQCCTYHHEQTHRSKMIILTANGEAFCVQNVLVHAEDPEFGFKADLNLVPHDTINAKDGFVMEALEKTLYGRKDELVFTRHSSDDKGRTIDGIVLDNREFKHNLMLDLKEHHADHLKRDSVADKLEKYISIME